MAIEVGWSSKAIIKAIIETSNRSTRTFINYGHTVSATVSSWDALGLAVKT